MAVDIQALWDQAFAQLAPDQPDSIQQSRKAWQIASDYLSPKDLDYAFETPSSEVLQALQLLRHVHSTESLLQQFLGALRALAGKLRADLPARQNPSLRTSIASSL